jgi:hypothetical protein
MGTPTARVNSPLDAYSEEFLPESGEKPKAEVEEGQLRLYDPKIGERLRTPEEAEADRRAAEKKVAMELKARQAAEAKTAQELAARLAAEAELARLREELAKLQEKQK